MAVSVAAVICAAGSSSRMGGVKKEFLPMQSLSPKTQSTIQNEDPQSKGSKAMEAPRIPSLSVLGAALSAFVSCHQIEHIIITLPAGTENAEALAGIPDELHSQIECFVKGHSYNEKKRIHFVPGGATRRASVHNALKRLKEFQPSHVLIHDGARPWIKKELIEQIIKRAIQFGAVIPALPLSETPKELGDSAPGLPTSSAETQQGTVSKMHGSPPDVQFIKRHLKRGALCTAQTPQGFRFPELLAANEKAAEREEKDQIEYTDDAEVWGEFAGQVAVIPGAIENKKITYPEDLDSTA